MNDWIEGHVVENIHWTDHLFSLQIDAVVEDFIAGQFTSLALDIGGERVARPYSFLNAPTVRPLEFFLYQASGGVLSTALSQLVTGDRIWVKAGANGFFTLNEVPAARDLWLIATGTGVAPFYSILLTDEPWQRFENIVLVNAVRHGADLCYKNLVAGLRDLHGRCFRHVPFVSRETVSGALPGRIPAALANGSLESALGLSLAPETSQVMLCGNPEMVADATELLKSRGLRKNRRRTPGHITTENYW